MTKERVVSYKVYESDLERARQIAAQRIIQHKKATQPEVFRELLDAWEAREAGVTP